MACIRLKKCNSCGKEVNVNIHSFRGICPACKKAEADKLRREHLAGLKGLTVEERLERIEAQLYNLNGEGRLARLESSNRRYAEETQT